jgi:hypothetical protein
VLALATRWGYRVRCARCSKTSVGPAAVSEISNVPAALLKSAQRGAKKALARILNAEHNATPPCPVSAFEAANGPSSQAASASVALCRNISYSMSVCTSIPLWEVLTWAGKGIAVSPASKQHHYAGRDTYADNQAAKERRGQPSADVGADVSPDYGPNREQPHGGPLQVGRENEDYGGH